MARAQCTWNPAFAVSDHATHPSGAFTFSWTAAPGCSSASFSLHHYQVVLKESDWPTGPDDGDWTFNQEYGTSKDGFIHRAERHVYARIYACDNADCSDVWGDEGNETLYSIYANRDEGTTEQEIWLVTSVGDTDPDTDCVTSEASAIAPSSFRFPSSWSNGNKWGIYYSLSDDIMYMNTTSTGWLDFNTATWTTAVSVSGSHDTNNSYEDVTHSYVLPVTNSSGHKLLWLMAQNAGTAGTDKHVVGVNSLDDDTDDFDLTCSTCCDGSTSGECDWPGQGGVEICVDGTDSSSACANLNSAQHGRFMWDYITNEVPDVDEDPIHVVFTGGNDDDDCAAIGDPEGDVFWASWDTTNIEWDVYTHTEGSYDCPTAIAEDHHDPGVTPLPAGEFKMYVEEGVGTFHIYYYDGSEWEDGGTSPLFYLDDSTTAYPEEGTQIDPDCLDNLDSFAYLDGSTPREGMFFNGTIDNGTRSGITCSPGFPIGGIFFAELQN